MLVNYFLKLYVVVSRSIRVFAKSRMQYYRIYGKIRDVYFTSKGYLIVYTFGYK